MNESAPHICEMCNTRKLSAFSELGKEELSDLSEHKACVFFKKGQIIMHEGSRPTGVYCIHHGKAKFYKLGQEGKEQIIRFAKDGDLLGYRSILSGEAVSVSIAALEDTHACFLPKAMLFEVIENNPKFSLNIMKMACHELGEAGKLITNLAQKSVTERLAEMLLILKETFGEDADGNIDISLTREELASMVGTATESVIRLLSKFKEDELISIKGRKIKVENPVKLARVGNVFD